MKKMGTLASASGDVRSTTLEPASMPALMTDKTAYESLEIETFLECSFGSLFMAGSNTLLAQALWQTTEHSIGVTLMFKNPCWLSTVRPSISPVAESGF